jgi:adenylosuccinate lyase
MHAVRHGVGRESAHEAIREHAVAVALAMREQGAERNDLLERLARDSRLGLSREQIATAVQSPLGFTGAAVDQVDAVVAQVARVVGKHPEAAAYRPGDIL